MTGNSDGGGSFWDQIGVRPAFEDLFGSKATSVASGLFNSLGGAFKKEDGSVDIGKLLGVGGGIANLLGLFGDSEPPRVGYQGGIPRYQAVRSEVPGLPDPNRRPGASPQRSFSDVVYAQRPSGQTPPSVAQAQAQTDQQAQQLAQRNQSFAAGGLASLSPQGYYLGGMTDGMADQVPAVIDGQQPAAMSDGEFVVPADVVSHLGNGNSNAGARELYDMLERIRQARTGNPQQGQQINPKRQLPV